MCQGVEPGASGLYKLETHNGKCSRILRVFSRRYGTHDGHSRKDLRWFPDFLMVRSMWGRTILGMPT